MSWVHKVENYGKCIIVNENAELEPVKCDSNHNTICLVNNSLLIKREHGVLDGMQKTCKENRSPGNVHLFNINAHDIIALHAAMKRYKEFPYWYLKIES